MRQETIPIEERLASPGQKLRVGEASGLVVICGIIVVIVRLVLVPVVSVVKVAVVRLGRAAEPPLAVQLQPEQRRDREPDERDKHEGHRRVDNVRPDLSPRFCVSWELKQFKSLVTVSIRFS